MKLKNKKTGEIVEFRYLQSDYVAPLVLTTYENDKPEMYSYNSLAELNAEWEDYEEPKEYWFINSLGEAIRPSDTTDWVAEDDAYHKAIGNHFDTREEAEKAVKKLKIYNKLKQKGFVFSGWYYSTEGQLVILADNHEFSETEPEDLTELFGDKIC